jgi:hypothetical protein
LLRDGAVGGDGPLMMLLLRWRGGRVEQSVLQPATRRLPRRPGWCWPGTCRGAYGGWFSGRRCDERRSGSAFMPPRAGRLQPVIVHVPDLATAEEIGLTASRARWPTSTGQAR